MVLITIDEWKTMTTRSVGRSDGRRTRSCRTGAGGTRTLTERDGGGARPASLKRARGPIPPLRAHPADAAANWQKPPPPSPQVSPDSPRACDGG